MRTSTSALAARATMTIAVALTLGVGPSCRRAGRPAPARPAVGAPVEAAKPQPAQRAPLAGAERGEAAAGDGETGAGGPVGEEPLVPDPVDAKLEAAAIAASEFGSPLRVLAEDVGGGGGGGGGGGKGDGGPDFPRPLPQPDDNRSGTSPRFSTGGNPVIDDGDDDDDDDRGLDIGQIAINQAQPLVNRTLELTVPISDYVATKFFEPEPTRGGLSLTATFVNSDGAQRWTVPGFWNGSAWKVRFAPTTPGQWSYDVVARDDGGNDRATGVFNAGTSAAGAFLRIQERRLRGLDNAWFRGVGYNIGWQYDVEGLTFAQMTESDMNLLSFWMQVPWDSAPEQRRNIEHAGIGTYDQTVSAYLDGVVARAEAAGVRLLPSIWSHDHARDVGHPWGNPHWSENPYSAITTAGEFFTVQDGAGNDTAQWTAQKNLYRYMMARWGTSPAIIGWVAMVEANGTTAWEAGGVQQAKISTWTIAVRDHFRSLDPFRALNASYPLTTTLTGSYLQTAPTALDMLGADSYQGTEHHALPSVAAGNPGVAVQIASLHEQMANDENRFGLITEFGGDVVGTPATTQPLHLHNGLWAGIGAGATIAPLLWSDGGDFPLLTHATFGQPMRDEIERVAAFQALAAVEGLDGVALVPQVVPDDAGWMIISASVADRGVSWIATLDGAPLAAGEALSIGGMPAGDYRVVWFDTERASATTVVETVTIAAPGTLLLDLPDFATVDAAASPPRPGRPDVTVIYTHQPPAIVAPPAGSG